MQPIPEAFEHILAAWNETDPARVRGHLDRALAPGVVFVDPLNFISGRDAFERMIAEFREKYPASVVRRTSGLDAHHRRCRYTWEIAENGRVFVRGTDFVELDENDLIVRVEGFFGDLPPLES